MSGSIEIKISKSNHPIPVVSSIHLHSIYNPVKEAEAFARSCEKKLKESSKILIFGLGFGYHIQAIEKRMQSLYGKSYEISVIEPNEKLISLWKEYRQVSTSSRVRIVGHSEPQRFYEDELLTDFLVSKPCIISHTASFQLNESFYKGFMSFSYPKDTTSSSRFVSNKDLREQLVQENQSSTEDYINASEQKKSLKKWDFLTLTLKQFSKQD
jgi:hypothetical protein